MKHPKVDLQKPLQDCNISLLSFSQDPWDSSWDSSSSHPWFQSPTARHKGAQAALVLAKSSECSKTLSLKAGKGWIQRWVKLKYPVFSGVLWTLALIYPAGLNIPTPFLVDVKSLHSLFHSLAVMSQNYHLLWNGLNSILCPLTCKNDQKYEIWVGAPMSIPLQAQDHPNQSMSEQWNLAFPSEWTASSIACKWIWNNT